MRLPVQPSPPAPPVEDLYEIRERPPVTPARFVRTRNLPPLILPPRQKPREPAQGGRETPPAAAAPVGEERRRTDRRVAQVPVLLDTRSGRDRRQAGGGQGGGVDIEA